MYYVAYNPVSGNALLGISYVNHFPGLPAEAVVESREGDMPDMSKCVWVSDTSVPYFQQVGTDRPNRLLTKKDFIKRFTPDEYAAVKYAASVNNTVDYYWQLFVLAEDICLDDADTVDGLYLLVAGGLLTEARVLEILS